MRLLKKRLFRRGIGVAIALAQLVLVFATATESLRASASAHVEQSGTQRHFAHNEATCPVCTAQSMHARTVPYPPPAAVVEHRVAAMIQRVDGRVASAPFTANGSRAPPALA